MLVELAAKRRGLADQRSRAAMIAAYGKMSSGVFSVTIVFWRIKVPWQGLLKKPPDTFPQDSCRYRHQRPRCCQ